MVMLVARIGKLNSGSILYRSLDLVDFGLVSYELLNVLSMTIEHS
jgi:hypothetical protein